MASDGKFAHISVSSDDEDDFVIHAGARAEQRFTSTEPASDPALGQTDSRPGAGEGACAPSEQKDSAPEAAQPRVSDGRPAGGEPAASRAQKDGYRETTLEDLEGGSMSSLQKGVVVAAIAGILAFVLWYVVLH